MKIVHADDVRAWHEEGGTYTGPMRSIGVKRSDPAYLERLLGLPFHLRFAIEALADEGGELERKALDAIPFYSLCRGLFLPLSGLQPAKVAELFGVASEPPPDAAAREELLRRFVDRPIGLSLPTKLGCILGDPFLGKPGTFRRDSLITLLQSVVLRGRRQLLDRLPVVGDVAVLFAESRPRLREEPPLTAAEVLEALRFVPRARKSVKFEVLRSLLSRMGKLEAYFLAKLLLRKAGFGFDYQGPLLARTIARHFQLDPAAVGHAIALTDAFHVVRVLSDEGPEALRKIQLQPLVPVRPALATGTVDEIKRFPVWVERKYDGIRLMLHKSADAHGSVVCGAYTRNRHDWLELVPGLDAAIRALPARNAIVDGELYGTVLDVEGPRPATVYEVYSQLQGEKAARPVTFKFAAFDLIFLNGQDLTRLKLLERRQRLQALLGGLAGYPLPVPLSISEAQLAQSREDVQRLYGHFRAQGYEGVIGKDPEGTYVLGERDPTWVKKKPEITLDLVLLGAVLAVTEKENVGRFGSYVIGARRPEGDYVDVGDVAGVDRERDAQIQREILSQGLLTGRRIERPSSSGARPGYELRPSIVVTVKFEGITRDTVTKRLALRDPKIAVIRGDKSASEADLVAALDELELRQRVR